MAPETIMVEFPSLMMRQWVDHPFKVSMFVDRPEIHLLFPQDIGTAKGSHRVVVCHPKIIAGMLLHYQIRRLRKGLRGDFFMLLRTQYY
jgi:hypothetical protein